MPTHTTHILHHHVWWCFFCEKMRQNLAQILSREENIELRELCLLNFDRSSAFIALLFLAREEEYELYQEEFYGKLFVKKADKKEKIEEEN